MIKFRINKPKGKKKSYTLVIDAENSNVPVQEANKKVVLVLGAKNISRNATNQLVLKRDPKPFLGKFKKAIYEPENKLRGGFGDNMGIDELAKKYSVPTLQYNKIYEAMENGIKVESELSSDFETQKEIAFDHFVESGLLYYDELDKAETRLEENPVKFEAGGLVAPNGKPSNLTPEQYKLVRTPEFKAWFGDWENSPETASKVVDENGEPLVVWHGTTSNYIILVPQLIKKGDNGVEYIDEAEMRKMADRYFSDNNVIPFRIFSKKDKKHIGTNVNLKNFWFSKNKNVADTYAKNNRRQTSFGDELNNNRIDKHGNLIHEYSNYELKHDFNFKNIANITDSYDLEKIEYLSNEEGVIFPYLPNSIRYAYKILVPKSNLIDLRHNIPDGYSVDYKGELLKENIWGEVFGYVGKFFLNIKNAYKIDWNGRNWNSNVNGKDLSVEIESAYKLNYDGVIIRNIIDASGIGADESSDEFVVFDSMQIKLADGTNTTFDIENPDIRFENGGGVIPISINWDYEDAKRKHVELNMPLYAITEKSKTAEIEEMTPDEYLRRVSGEFGISDAENIQYVSGENVDRLAEQMKAGNAFEIPYLTIGEKAQDGRTRALAAKKLGVNSIPVIVFRKLRDTEYERAIKKMKDLSIDEVSQYLNENFGVSEPISQSEYDKFKHIVKYMKFEQGDFVKCEDGTEVQSILMSKEEFSLKNAKIWLAKHGYKQDVDETENYYRFRQQEPEDFQEDSFRTIEFTDGIKAVIGCPIHKMSLGGDVYAGKREFAARKMAKNAMKESLTEEQHEALANLCKIRHNIHSSKDSVIKSDEQGLKQELVKANDKILESGLKPMGFVGFDVDGDYIDIDSIQESMTNEGVSVDDENFQAWYDDNYEAISNKLEELNAKIENYLSEIDAAFGTEYSPSGMSRVFEKGSIVENKEIEKMKIENETDLGKGGAAYDGDLHINGGIPAIIKETKQPIEIEVGEVIITRPAAIKYCEELNEINQAGGGKPIDCDCLREQNKEANLKDQKMIGKIDSEGNAKFENGDFVNDKTSFIKSIYVKHGLTPPKITIVKDGVYVYVGYNDASNKLMKIFIDNDSLNKKPFVEQYLCDADDRLIQTTENEFEDGGKVITQNINKSLDNEANIIQDAMENNDMVNIQQQAGMTLFEGGGEIYDEAGFTFMKNNPMSRARAIGVLEKSINVSDVFYPTTYQWIEGLESGLIAEYRTFVSRKTDSETEKPTLADFIVSKAEMDYYIYLQNGGVPYSKVVEKQKEKDLLRQQVLKKEAIEREEKNRQERIEAEKRRLETIKYFLTTDLESIIRKYTSYDLIQIQELNKKRQTSETISEIKKWEGYLVDRSKGVAGSYTTAHILYKINSNGEVEQNREYKVGDIVYINVEDWGDSPILTEIVEVKNEASYIVKKTDQIHNPHIGYDQIIPKAIISKYLQFKENALRSADEISQDILSGVSESFAKKSKEAKFEMPSGEKDETMSAVVKSEHTLIADVEKETENDMPKEAKEYIVEFIKDKKGEKIDDDEIHAIAEYFGIDVPDLESYIYTEFSKYMNGDEFEGGGEINSFTYQMLDRLKSDCDYYLGNGNRNEKNLWALNVDDQIKEMKRLWNILPEDGKPSWLSMADILEYERKMKNKFEGGGKVGERKAVEFRNWIYSVNADVEKLPERTFMDKSLYATTGAAARLVVIDKPDDGGNDDNVKEIEETKDENMEKPEEPVENKQESTDRRKFNIPSQIKHLYKANGDLSNVENWHGEFFNEWTTDMFTDDYKSGKTEQQIKDEESKIGYVLISLDSNNIIPITRYDEHQTGFDALENIIYPKFKVKEENYVSFWVHNNAIAYGKDDRFFKAAVKFIEYGGNPNNSVWIIDQEKKNSRTLMTVAEYIRIFDRYDTIDLNNEPNVSYLGEKFISKLTELSDMFSDYHLNVIRQSSDKFKENLFKKISEFEDVLSISTIDDEMGRLIKQSNFYELVHDGEKNGVSDYILSEIEKEVFSFNGIKNVIHKNLKQGNTKLSNFFFNTQKALDEFNKIDIADKTKRGKIKETTPGQKTKENMKQTEVETVGKYILGMKWESDFPSQDMLKTAIKSDIGWGVENLKKLKASFVDINAHASARQLDMAIESLIKGDVESAKKELSKFQEMCKSEISTEGAIVDTVAIEKETDLESDIISRFENALSEYKETKDKKWMIVKYGKGEGTIVGSLTEYLSEIVLAAKQPEKMVKFYEMFEKAGLGRKQNIPFEVFSEDDEYCDFSLFSDAGKNLFEMIPESMKKVRNIKQISYKVDHSDEGLRKILTPFVGEDGIRPILGGIFFDEKGVVATDAHVLGFINGKSKENGLYCLASNCFDALPDGVDPIETPLKETYPQYVRTIPIGNNKRDVINLNGLELFLNGVINGGLLKSDCPTTIVKIDDVVLGFNADYLLKAIKFMKQLGYDKVEISGSEPSKPVLLMPVGSGADAISLNKPFALVMPVWLSEQGYKKENENFRTLFNEGAIYFDCNDESVKVNTEKEVPVVELSPESIAKGEIEKTKAELRKEADENKKQLRAEVEKAKEDAKLDAEIKIQAEKDRIAKEVADKKKADTKDRIAKDIANKRAEKLKREQAEEEARIAEQKRLAEIAEKELQKSAKKAKRLAAINKGKDTIKTKLTEKARKAEEARLKAEKYEEVAEEKAMMDIRKSEIERQQQELDILEMEMNMG